MLLTTKVTLRISGIVLAALLFAAPSASSQQAANPAKSLPFLEKGSYVIGGSASNPITNGMAFRAQAGQRLSISLETEKGKKATFSLLIGRSATDKGENAYSDDSVNVQQWSEVLRKTADYQVLIETKEDAVSYKLKVRLE